jgi:hypothetical protein
VQTGRTGLCPASTALRLRRRFEFYHRARRGGRRRFRWRASRGGVRSVRRVGKLDFGKCQIARSAAAGGFSKLDGDAELPQDRQCQCQSQLLAESAGFGWPLLPTGRGRFGSVGAVGPGTWNGSAAPRGCCDRRGDHFKSDNLSERRGHCRDFPRVDCPAIHFRPSRA